MRRTLLLFLLLSLLVNVCWAQKGAGATGGGAKPAQGGSATAASAGLQQSGFVYYLRYKKKHLRQHLQYATQRTEVYYFTDSVLKDKNVASFFGAPIDKKKKKQLVATVSLDRRPGRYLQFGLRSFEEYDLRPVKLSFKALTPDTSLINAPTQDTLAVVTLIYYDSIPRFWDIHRKSIFTKSRLRFAITQDSAILLTRLYYADYSGNYVRNADSITNPNWNPHLSAINPGSVHIQPIGPQLIELRDSLPLYMLHSLNQLKFPENGLAHWTAYRPVNFSDPPNPLAVYLADLATYGSKLKDYNEALFVAALGNYDDTSKNRVVIEAYRDLAPRYFRLIRDYHRVTHQLKDSVNTLRYTMLDPLTTDTPKAELDFLQGLYVIETTKAQPPPSALPPDRIDQNIPEMAINISNPDSADAFYLRIIHKAVTNQSMYYKKLHYGTWDYGSLTVPLRYRPAPAHNTISATEGKGTTVPVPAPSASDASISLSAYIGRKWGHTRFFEDPSMTANMVAIEPVLITGPTLIALSLSNVDSSSRYANHLTQNSYIGPSNMLAWSFGTGIVVQYKTVNLGLFVGTDVPLVAHIGWVYAGHPWIGFGIGVNLGMLSSGSGVN